MQFIFRENLVIWKLKELIVFVFELIKLVKLQNLKGIYWKERIKFFLFLYVMIIYRGNFR